LTGSERLFKTNAGHTSNSIANGSFASNNTRMEGKYINLSLHYLEQVIVALQEKGWTSLFFSSPKRCSFFSPYVSHIFFHAYLRYSPTAER
jgi:hypothetical protein